MMKIYIGEDAQYKGHSLSHAIVRRLKELGLAGVTVTRGIEGYGRGGRIRTLRILELTSSLPLILEVVDRPERIAAALPEIEAMVDEGLVLLADVQVVKYGRKGSPAGD